ncbi:SYNE1 [Lepeophtheirus salmonis]|uniref:SYNE1 n=2 Tax=Lepeophtheirus salmonis TaxID=72036 RepID=A0A7R8HE32_LEPSM|nr:SYNE1 [Lepeophtheirus salmonis]CAF3041055.1 SYNE1 [Lepeophtheirus salmonis]
MSTPRNSRTTIKRGAESPVHYEGQQQQPRLSSTRKTSPGPGSIYRTMPLSSPPSHPGGPTAPPPSIIRPIPQHHGVSLPGYNSSSPRAFSPITVPKVNQSPAMSPVPFSPISMQRYSSSVYEYESTDLTSSVSQATADIIASQSQDYVDEQLAEFQEQILRLQARGPPKRFSIFLFPWITTGKEKKQVHLLLEYVLKLHILVKKKTDATDRTSEDPRRHSIPRASLASSPTPMIRDTSPSAEEMDPEKTGTKRKTKRRSKERSESRSGPSSSPLPRFNPGKSPQLPPRPPSVISQEDVSSWKTFSSDEQKEGFLSKLRQRRSSGSSISSIERAVAQSPKKVHVVHLEEVDEMHSPSSPEFPSSLIGKMDISIEEEEEGVVDKEISFVDVEEQRKRTPDPDYDKTSVVSSGNGSLGRRKPDPSHRFSLLPQHFHHPRATKSELNFHMHPRTPSTPSPRLSQRAPSSDSFFGRNIGSPQGQIWYHTYTNESFPNRDSIFGNPSGGSSSSVDGRMSHIRDEQERVQKKTFVNWINSYLCKHSPPMKVLSGENLPMEKSRVLKRPHFLSNCNTALEFLKSKRIKLVNINASDVVDGRPPVVLGLIWTIILYFQIEENTRVLEKLGHRYGSPHVDGRSRSQMGHATDDSSDDRSSRKVNEKWKAGAKRALLQWCQSWRDGNAFIGMVNGIKPGSVDVKAMVKEENKTRLETAFYVAECKLGIARLLDPEDVDVDSPDEKSIMTYVAQFLHRYPEGEEVEGDFVSAEQQFNELRTWLTTTVDFFEQMHKGSNTKFNLRSYSDYDNFKSEFLQKKEVFDRLNHLMNSNKTVGINEEIWNEVDTNWKKVQAQARHWQWLLDSTLPGEFGEIGDWLNKAEALIYSDDIPLSLNEESAAIVNQKLEEHKDFFSNLHSVCMQFQNAVSSSPLVHEIQEGQLRSMSQRLDNIESLSEIREVRLKYLEHKCCIAREDNVQEIMDQYRTFVSQSKIFQEFEKAYHDFEQVCDEYKKRGGIGSGESAHIDNFILNIAKHVSVWSDKFEILDRTVAFLVATCDPVVSQELQTEFKNISTNWEKLFQNAGKEYIHGSNINRTKSDYESGLENLDRWLRKAEGLLCQKQSLNSSNDIKDSLEVLMNLHSEISKMEEVFKKISKCFQLLVKELSQEDIEKMMLVLKKEKENFVIVRSMIPSKVQLYHHLFTQLEAINENEKIILDWCNETNALITYSPIKEKVEDIKRTLSSVPSVQATYSSLKNVHLSILKNIHGRDDFDTFHLEERINHISYLFTDTVNKLKSLEVELLKGNDAWDKFHESENKINSWMVKAESLMAVRKFESRSSVVSHKEFFDNPEGNTLMNQFLQVARDLGPHIQSKEEKNNTGLTIQNIEAKWKNIRDMFPLHLIKAEFRLDEESFDKYLKEIDKHMSEEGIAFQKDDHHNIETLIQNHNTYFESGEPVKNAQSLLLNLDALSKAYKSLSKDNDDSLVRAYGLRSQEWSDLMDKRIHLFAQLEKVPEQWNEYEHKFHEMINWMNSVELTLNKMFQGEPTPEDFSSEKAKFDSLCEDIDAKREDMQWLVQSLNQLMSHRPNKEGLAEQARLEELVTRYKSMIPLIDKTKQKIDVYSRSYQFKSDVVEVKYMLENLTSSSIPSISEAFSKEDDTFIQKLINEQENIVQKLEEYRSPILKLLQQGKDLQKHKNCPSFLKEVVKDLESKWNDAYSLTVDRLKTFKDGSIAISTSDHGLLVEDLKNKSALRNEIKSNTGDLIRKMKMILEELETVSEDSKCRFDLEISDIELDLQKLFDECDQKLNYLKDLDVKWNTFNKGMGDLKEWIVKAKSQLQQILESDMSPEDRMKLLCELKNEVITKTDIVCDLERGIEGLLNGSVDNNVDKINEIRGDVECVRKDVNELETKIVEKNEMARLDLDNWNEYKAFVNEEIKPCLERAELRIAVGLTRPHNLNDVKTARTDIASFEDECNPIQNKLEIAFKKMNEIHSKTSADHEVDALKSKWHSVKSTLDQWNQKMENLEKSWDKFNEDSEKLNSWLETIKKDLSHLSDASASDPQEINGIIQKLKEMSINIAQRQSVILNLTQDCDSICLNLNHEGVIRMREKLSDLKSKMSKLSEENRCVMEKISDSFALIQDFEFKVDGFEAWLKSIENSIGQLNEIPAENINSALDTTHDLSQQHQDKKFDLDKIKKELDVHNSSTEDGLTFGFGTQNPYHLFHIYNILLIKSFSSEELEIAGSELDNLAVQCQTRKSEGSDDEEIAVKSKTYVIKSGKPMSILLLVADILQKIVDLKNFFGEKEKQLHQTDDKWDEFKLAEKNLADWLQLILHKVQKISIADSSIDSLKDAAKEVSSLIQDCKDQESLRDNYYNIGKELMSLDSSQVNVLQDALSEAGSKWEKVYNLLHEQESKSKALIGMWQQCNQQGIDLKEQLDQCQDSYNALNSIDKLKKARHPFEMFYKRQTQLIQELQTVPSFDVSSLKKEIQTVQQKFSFLGTNLKLKLNKFESQIVIWKQINANMEEFLSWNKDTQNSLNDGLINVSDVEAVRSKLDRFHHDFPLYSNQCNAGIFAKLNQIIEINEEKTNIFGDEKDKCNKELHITEELAKKLEASLRDVDSSSKVLKSNMSDALTWLINLQKLTLDLENFDDRLIPITQDIKNLHERYEGSEVNNLMKDLGNLEKKYDALSSQVSKIMSTLFGLLEKRYSDKVQDLLKCISLNKEKVAWCSPDPDSDKFALNSKLETLSEIRDALKQLIDSNEDLKILSKILLKLVDEDKVKEINETIYCLDNGIAEIQNELISVNDLLNSAIALFNKYALKMEEASNWIKETEESIKTNLIADLESAKQISGDCEQIENNILSYEPNVTELVELSKEILRKHPASRAGGTADHIKSKYEHFKATISEQLSNIKDLIKNQSAQKNYIDAYEKWLKNCKNELKEFENIDDLKSKQLTIKKLTKLKEIISGKDIGHKLLERAISEGENLFSYIPKNDRETIRCQIREMRDGWEDLIDYMNVIQKNVAGLAMQWSSFDESFEQAKNWLESSNKKLNNAKQDVNSHYTILENMRLKSEELNNCMAMDALKTCSNEYETLKSNVCEQIDIWKGYVTEHEDYRTELEKVADFINNSDKEYTVLCVDAPTAASEIEEEDRIEMLSSIIGCDGSVVTGLKEAKIKLQAVNHHTLPDGKEILKKELSDLEQKWKNTLSSAKELKEKITACSSKKAKAKKSLNELGDWVVEMELKLKNSSSLKDNSKEKQNHLLELENLQKRIAKKADDFKHVSVEISESDNDIQQQLASLNNRYQYLKKNIKDLIIRYGVFVKDHSSFDVDFTNFMEWMRGVKEDLNSFGELNGDLKVLQTRKMNIEALEEIKNSENLKYDSISELGEKLYSHTSASGKEVIRGSLKNLRCQWDELTSNLQSASLSLEKCLQQFSDFTTLQEKLTKWLKDIERAMQGHTELKSSLPEKKGQLQNHSIVHQEITSHNGLVDSVCTKAQDLVDQTQDTALNAYIHSIKLLFQNIGLKSKDLMDKLKGCVEDHENYITQFKHFIEFFANQSDLVSQCGDIMGEKVELDHKTSLLNELKENKVLGDKLLGELDQSCLTVCKSTALKGCDYLKEELNQIKENWNTHEALIDELEINIEKANGQWDQFHSDLDKHLEWFKKYESFFKDQTLMNNLIEKEERLKFFDKKRNDVIFYEKVIDDFVNSSHTLIQNTGAERLKPAVTQVSNRYQLLHVMSKEVLAKWQAFAEEHELFDHKRNDVCIWLENLESKIDSALRESNIEIKSKLLSSVLVEDENAISKLNAVSSIGERLYPDTGSQGRDKIRQILKDLRSRWDIIVERAHNLQKKQDVQLRAWVNYRESLEQAQSWLDSVVAEIGDKNFCIPLIEIVNEKGAAVVETNPHADVDEIQHEIENNMEDAIDSIQVYQDLQKVHMEWQKNMWDSLSLCTDYNGNKNLLDSRVKKIKQMEKQRIDESNDVLSKMTNLISDLEKNQNMLGLKVKEELSRDLSSIQFDFQKFTSSIKDVECALLDRLNQWTEYEGQLEKLLSWLNESENIDEVLFS